MFLLDTNVISELRKPNACNQNVLNWAQRHKHAEFFLSVITIFEIEKGILQHERRNREQATTLRHWLENSVIRNFADRILAVDLPVARRCAQLHIPDPRSERDALIAATALVHSLIVVTRNISDFTDTGVKLLNPWNFTETGNK